MTPLAPARYIPAAVRRAVYERDKGQCSYIDPNGRRCEFDHRKPFGRGGDRSVNNLRLLCRAHNGYFAERDCGKEMMKRYRRSADRVSEPAAFYTIGNRADDAEKRSRKSGTEMLYSGNFLIISES